MIRRYIYGFIAAIVALVVSILKHQRDAARIDAATAERDAAKRDAVAEHERSKLAQRAQQASERAAEDGARAVQKAVRAPGRDHFAKDPWDYGNDDAD